MPYIMIFCIVFIVYIMTPINTSYDSRVAKPRQDMDYPIQSFRGDSLMQIHPTYSEGGD